MAGQIDRVGGGLQRIAEDDMAEIACWHSRALDRVA